MSVSHFEKLVDEEMAKLAQASLQVALGDSHRSALIKGKHEGLVQAKELHRLASQTDMDDKF